MKKRLAAVGFFAMLAVLAAVFTAGAASAAPHGTASSEVASGSQDATDLHFPYD